MDFLLAALMGIIEGLTEFIPVSSTAHLLLAEKLLNFHSTNDAFVVLIQLGAILAVMAYYFTRLWHVLITLPTSKDSQNFAISVFVAFIPAALLGFGLHHYIKAMFDRVDIICYGLIIGGIILWLVDKYAPKHTHVDALKLDLKTSLLIGVFQCFALVPGMSRSGSTLIGALLCKVEKRAAAEFSFFLAIPTMIGAFALDFIKSAPSLTSNDYGLIGLGFIVSFITALLVIKPMLDFVSKRGYGFFAIWRIVVGLAGLAWFYYAQTMA